MPTLSPPPDLPNAVTLADGGPDHVRFRLLQLSWTTATIAATTWICTFGPIPSIFAVAVAKHVLVAIFVMGIGLDERQALNTQR